jgi:hypothetical protein
MTIYTQRCRNPKCGELVARRRPPDPTRYRLLCPSCLYIGQRYFRLGAVVGGVIAGVISWWFR